MKIEKEIIKNLIARYQIKKLTFLGEGLLIEASKLRINKPFPFLVKRLKGDLICDNVVNPNFNLVTGTLTFNLAEPFLIKDLPICKSLRIYSANLGTICSLDFNNHEVINAVGLTFLNTSFLGIKSLVLTSCRLDNVYISNCGVVRLYGCDVISFFTDSIEDFQEL